MPASLLETADTTASAYPLEIHVSPEKGLHLRAARDISQGECILRECPVTMALEDCHAQTYCAFCAAKLSRVDTEQWKRRLRRLAAMGGEYEREGVLCEDCACNNYLVDLHNLMARFGVRVVVGASTSKSSSSSSTKSKTKKKAKLDGGLYRLFFRLFFDYAGSRENQLDDNVVTMDVRHVYWLAHDAAGVSEQVTEDIAAISNVIYQIYTSTTPDGTSPYTREQIATACKNVVCNQHMLSDDNAATAKQHAGNSGGEMVEVGRGLYPMAALLNHSCRPNVHWQAGTRTQSVMECTALLDIPQGTELTIAYMNPQHLQSLSRDARRALLQKHRHFLCHCELCSSKDDGIGGTGEPDLGAK